MSTTSRFTRLIAVILSFICIPFIILSNQESRPRKIIGLVPVRNEAHFIAQCLRSLALYTDAIVVLDDASEDNTLATIQSLAQECHVEKIIHKDVWLRDEPGDKTKLLQAGRELGGTHFITIDADEMFTAPCAKNNALRFYIHQLTPGDRLCIRFYELWGDLEHYREEKPKHIACIFCDDRKANYIASSFIHTSRHPYLTSGFHLILENADYALLHFDCVNLNHHAIKQTWYRCLERVRVPRKSLEAINKFYGPKKIDDGTPVYQTKTAWFSYPFFDSNVSNISHAWFEKQIRQWLQEYGHDYFAGVIGIEQFE